MITYKHGDLLKSGCDIICHQVNLQGTMGGGIALQIAKQYPKCEQDYKEYIKENGGDAFGTVFIWCKPYNPFIANCFTQTENFNTDYAEVRKCFDSIAHYAKENKLSVGIPYKYGCGIANGDWNQVEQIIKDIFLNTEIDCQIWQLNN